MKSRNFLHSNSIETKGPTAKGFLLARSPQADVATSSAVRRFELQHNSSPRFARRRQQRRQGQALLLAVLIMLLAALLSAGFLGVVSGNLNQSARIADKTRAIEASRAGIAFANAQLSGSSQGDLWRPVDVSPAPAPGTTGYDFYYSQLDKVQGWANGLPQNDPNYRNTAYGKFPDPNQVASDAPKFLVKVEELTTNTTAPDYDSNHAGEIKITSIGLSEDDPNVFHRSVAYKVGRKKSPWASALRSVSNWDFKDKTVPQAKLSAPTTSTGVRNLQVTVDATTQQGQFPAVPFNAVVIHKDATTPANSVTTPAVVTSVDKTNPNNPIYTLSGTIPNNPPAYATGDTLQIAASLGTADYVDYLNTGATPAPGQINVPRQDQPDGLLINGSAALRGQLQMLNLQEKGAKIQSSGAIYPTNDIPVTASGDVATTGNLSRSFDANFPGSFTPASGINKTDLVNDAWNKFGATKPLGLDYDSGTSRSVEPFTPVDITSKNNVNRYRALTRNSAAGVYIDNRDDVEKFFDSAATPPKLREMTQAQLVNMLVSPPVIPPVAPTDYTRIGTATTTAGASLEQQHLRGWVGPDEFLARGALVELIPGTVPKIRVTYDARSDANPNGPELSKTFRDANGNSQPGVYSQELDWPSNGTLFAEGNIRIRGNVQLPVPPATGSDPFPSLTVVSMNNIYIEGSLSVDDSTIPDPTDTNIPARRIPDPNRKKLMLLAKKNVIVNPTRAVLARTDVQTVSTNTTGRTIGAAPATFDLPVANAYAFNKGDYITFAAQKTVNDPTAITVRGLVTSIQTPTSTQITIVTPNAGYLPGAANAIVRSPLEKREEGTVASKQNFFSLINNETAINRRIVVPFGDDTTPGYNKLDLDHVADLKKNGADVIGFKISAKDISTLIQRPTAPTFIAELTNKQPLKTTPMGSQDLDPIKDAVQDTDKVLRTYNNYTLDNQRFFYDPPVNKTLLDLVTDAQAVTQQRTIAGTPPVTEGYKYEASLIDFLPQERIDLITGLPDPAKSIGNLSYHVLTGVGLRYQPAATDTSLNNRREDFNDPKTYTVPLATSVEIDLNGGSSWAKRVSSAPVTRYFGFAPVLADTEDMQTVDVSFYQSSDSLTKSTVDARILDFASNPAGTYGSSFVLRRANAPSTTLAPAFTLLPDYRVKSLKYEYADLNSRDYKPVAKEIQINAFVYAQEGSWLVVPGDYFRSDSPVRGEINSSTQALEGSYIDYNNNRVPDAGEYIVQGSSKIADLNRNGRVDDGEKDAALRFVRYNYAPIQFFGAIVENQTAVVTDVKDSTGNVILAKGAVQDWMDKWATYDDTNVANTEIGKPAQFNFISYAYDPSIANNSIGANELRVPVTDDLLYEQ